MVKHTDLDKKKLLLEDKLFTLKNKIKRAKMEHEMLIEKLEEKIEKCEKELNSVDNDTINKIQCCNLIFKSQSDYDKHLTTQSHRRLNEDYIHCSVCKKFFFEGINKTDYDKLLVRQQRNYKYNQHYNECCYCENCSEEFTTDIEKSAHKCEESPTVVEYEPCTTSPEPIKCVISEINEEEEELEDWTFNNKSYGLTNKDEVYNNEGVHIGYKDQNRIIDSDDELYEDYIDYLKYS